MRMVGRNYHARNVAPTFRIKKSIFSDIPLARLMKFFAKLNMDVPTSDSVIYSI